MNGAVPISVWHLAISAGMVLFAGLLSLGLRLGFARRLAVASLRTVVQLVAVGYLLGWVFSVRSAAVVISLLLGMIAVAAIAAVRRSSRHYCGVWILTFTVLLLSGLSTTLGATAVVIEVEPWWRPQYCVPLLGMVLGNSLTGVSLCLDDLLQSFDERRADIETELALGASRWEAARTPVVLAIRRGMIPIINAMSVVGVVSLPGMMTGQILQGADPRDAVRYQIMVMFMVAGATTLSCVLLALATYRRMFNAQHQLQSSRIRSRRATA